MYLQQAHIPRPRTVVRRNRGSAITVITLLHVAGIYAFVTAIHPIKIEAPKGPIDVSFLPNVEPTVLPPPPPTFKPYAPPIPVPIDPVIEFTMPSEPNAAIAVPRPPDVAQPPAVLVVPAPVLSPARTIPGTHKRPEYPALSRRLGEEGSVRLALTIAEDGMVIDAVVVKSSGFARLDAAAIEWIKGHWRYTPAMRGRMPIKATAETTLTFKLE